MKNTNEYGSVEISKEAFDDMANIVANKVKGIVPAKKSGISDCVIKDGDLTVNLNIKIKTGVDVQKTSSKLQTKVHETIGEMTGIDCKKINVNVLGFVE